MELQFTFTEEEITASLSGELDHHSAAGIRARIDEVFLLRRPERLVLELSGVNFMDSSGLGLILGRYTKASENGASLVLLNPTGRIEKLIAISGMADKIPIEYTEIPERTEEEKWLKNR